jgi:hypothetical protein
VLDLGQRQHARQHGAADAEFALAEVDRLVAGRRALHREVQALLRMTVAGVIEQADVGQDDGVDALVDRGIDGLCQSPTRPACGKVLIASSTSRPLAWA